MALEKRLRTTRRRGIEDSFTLNLGFCHRFFSLFLICYLLWYELLESIVKGRGMVWYGCIGFGFLIVWCWNWRLNGSSFVLFMQFYELFFINWFRVHSWFGKIVYELALEMSLMNFQGLGIYFEFCVIYGLIFVRDLSFCYDIVKELTCLSEKRRVDSPRNWG